MLSDTGTGQEIFLSCLGIEKMPPKVVSLQKKDGLQREIRVKFVSELR